MEGLGKGLAGERGIAVRGRLLAGMGWAHFLGARLERTQIGLIATALLPWGFGARWLRGTADKGGIPHEEG